MASSGTVTLAPPAAETRPTDPGRRVDFCVLADADPGTLPRVLELVAKRGLVPLTLTSRLADGMLAIEMEVQGMVRAESEHIGNCLRQIPMVAEVLVRERSTSVPLPVAAE
ncbi:hypothetical protein [Azospirillum thermophilum]|uniref:ACT domain-containing protein n=1 Tax=Azospirillum thermophilum TaxID=2202148 RepID=A0A2S2D0K6_9PROT|nr:hypothetical protein [Azospirillum thermophilum]AWK89997.1 hypothetical protein DEW08_28790 [Azospirillum thermophilum]